MSNFYYYFTKIINIFKKNIHRICICYNNFTMIRKKSSSGSYRRKRSDTKIGTIEKKYGKDFGVRSDKKLGKYLNLTYLSSVL